jgi:hypothetical protein
MRWKWISANRTIRIENEPRALADSIVRLDKLRGKGPWFAFASPTFLILGLIAGSILIANLNCTPGGPCSPSSGFGLEVAGTVVIFALFILSALVVAIDLEWIEHPRTHSGFTYVGLAAMTVATLAFLALLLEAVVNASGWVTPLTSFLVFGGFGLYLLVMNLVGWRAHLLGRVLPWIGVVGGAMSVIVAGFLFLPSTTVTQSVGSLALVAFGPIYIVWSLWLGFKLRGEAPAAAPSAA